MGAFSNYLEEKIVEHFLRNNAITPPTTVYVTLFESDPGEATGGTETAYTGYARQSATWTELFQRCIRRWRANPRPPSCRRSDREPCPMANA